MPIRNNKITPSSSKKISNSAKKLANAILKEKPKEPIKKEKKQPSIKTQVSKVLQAKNDIAIENATIRDIIDEETVKEQKEIDNAVKQAKKDVIEEQEDLTTWDFDNSLKDIPYFDVHCTYQASGYRPIDKTHGLKFRPEWFTEARDNYLRTGHYCQFVFGSKLYNQFWKKEYERCRNGMTVNGYTITGPNYFFLNYFQLDDNRVSKAGAGRDTIFPRFKTYQYEFFHYYELCRIYGYNCSMLKNRGCGFSFIVASILDSTYSCYPNSNSVISAYLQSYVDDTMDKVTSGLDFLNEHTDGGFFKARQVENNTMTKKASYYIMIDGQKVETGFMSKITGKVADNSRKVRGDRTNVLVQEEAGSNPILEESVIKGEELVRPGGNRIGVQIIGGTGGDVQGADGLRKIYEDPKTFNVLPFRHNYTPDHEYVLSNFFIPAYKTLDLPEYVDERGWCDEEKAITYYNKQRDLKAKTPSALLKYCAEQCFTAEEALALEGQNKFNRTLLANQIAYIRTHRDQTIKDDDGKEHLAVPPIKHGELKFRYKNNSEGIKLNNIIGVDFIEGESGSIHILEPPIDDHINNLYVAGIDAIDIGQEQTSDATTDPSKFCIIIFKRTYGIDAPKPVAYYLERPQKIDKAFQTALKLMYWYNAKTNIEATRLSCWNYAKARGYAKYFMFRPRATYMDLNARHSKTIGTPATPTIIDHQNDLIADYIEEFCDQIWFPELLLQLTRYSLEHKTKFDMVAAFAMALLADEELKGIIPKKQDDESENWQDVGFYYDENGIRRFGVIPKKQKVTIYSTTHINQSNYVRSSDPRRFSNSY